MVGTFALVSGWVSEWVSEWVTRSQIGLLFLRYLSSQTFTQPSRRSASSSNLPFHHHHHHHHYHLIIVIMFNSRKSTISLSFFFCFFITLHGDWFCTCVPRSSPGPFSVYPSPTSNLVLVCQHCINAIFPHRWPHSITVWIWPCPGQWNTWMITTQHTSQGIHSPTSSTTHSQTPNAACVLYYGRWKIWISLVLSVKWPLALQRIWPLSLARLTSR